MAGEHEGPVRENLLRMARINRTLVEEPPETFHEAVQWTLWFQMAARMYNSSGSLGRIDLLPEPFYSRDVAAGTLTDEEAVFHLACYLVLEAAHRLRIPVNLGVSVGERVDPGLLRRGIEIMVEDRCGTPKFLGVENTAGGLWGRARADARRR